MQFSERDRAWFDSEVPDAEGELAPDGSSFHIHVRNGDGVALMSLADFDEMQSWLEGADRMATEERDKAAGERDRWRIFAFIMAIGFASVLVWDVLR